MAEGYLRQSLSILLKEFNKISPCPCTLAVLLEVSAYSLARVFTANIRICVHIELQSIFFAHWYNFADDGKLLSGQNGSMEILRLGSPTSIAPTSFLIDQI